MAMKYILLFNLVAANISLNAQTFKDTDGNHCKTVTINKQVWMADNLNVSHFRSGEIIMQATTIDEWVKAGKEGKAAWCYYNNDSLNGSKYGKLYNYYAVTDPRGLAPKGWHVPSKTDFHSLITFLGGMYTAGFQLKNTFLWSLNGNGNNESGFMALPAGIRLPSGKFIDINDRAYLWTTSVEIIIGSGTQIYALSLFNSSSEAMYTSLDKSAGISIRCIRNLF
jgi:uncharacterized protein (TIGR02145 family)